MANSFSCHALSAVNTTFRIAFKWPAIPNYMQELENASRSTFTILWVNFAYTLKLCRARCTHHSCLFRLAVQNMVSLKTTWPPGLKKLFARCGLYTAIYSFRSGFWGVWVIKEVHEDWSVLS